MKRTILCLALCALLLLPGAGAAAADTGYSGAIDPETGEPYSGEADAARNGNGRVALSATMYYDFSTRDYVYPLGDGTGDVHASAADGMVLTSPVSITAPSGASVTVFLDGAPYTGPLDNCNRIGEYVVTSQAGGQSRRLLRFTLVGRTSSQVHTFVAPDGFYVVSAVRGEEDVYLDRYTVDMEPEGDYEIVYECTATGQSYTLKTSVDRTPPSLTFSGRTDAQGRIRSKLSFTGLDRDDTVTLLRGGEAVTPELNADGTGTIYDAGNYEMTVTDAAGNAVTYRFIILQYFNLQSWAFFLILAAVIGAVVGYIFIQRKRLKIG